MGVNRHNEKTSLYRKHYLAARPICDFLGGCIAANTNCWGMGLAARGDGYVYETRKSTRNSTFLENTDYQIRNLDLIHNGDLPNDDHINCFGVGFHRQWHAGVDLYRKNSSTAGATVRAIGAGTVYYAQNLNYPGAVVIIEHTLPKGNSVFSVYAHLAPGSLQVSTGQAVATGQNLGTVILNGHSGRFPALHPDGDDSHLHFEIRMPNNLSSLEWGQYLWLQQTAGSPTDYGTEEGDQFILTLKDAKTGHSLISDVIIDHTSEEYNNFTWLWVRIIISNAGSLSNRLVSPSYSSLTDGDVIASTMRIDDVSFITYCGSEVTGPEAPVGELIPEVQVVPIE